MTRKEFSDGMDTLLNSYSMAALHGDEASRMEIVLDEWEKSFFLTKAQDKVVLSLYSGKNASDESFETTEELRRYLANLVSEKTFKKEEDTYGKETRFKFDDDLWFIVYEEVDGVIEGGRCDGDVVSMSVYPVTHDEYNKIKKNPFRGVDSGRALRMDLSDNRVQIVSKNPVKRYFARYIRKPKPIILEDFPDDLTINGYSKTYDVVSEVTEDGTVKDKNVEFPACELHEALHQTILDEAVKLAYVAKSIGRTTEKDNK